MRFGRLYRDLVLAPLAEQLGAGARITTGDLVIDVLCDGGAATAQAGRLTGAPGSVTAVDYEADCLRAVCAMNADARVAECGRDALPCADAIFDVAINLVTAGWAGPALLDEMWRVTKPGGRITLLGYGGADAVHEKLLLESVAEITGEQLPYAADLMRPVNDDRLQTTTLRDVIRFDGVNQFWDVMTDGRTVVAGENAHPIRRLVATRLEPFTAADGTIRIPIDVALLTATR
jgi:SAM-dependent methyltransferase